MTLQALYDVPAPAKLNLFLHVVGRRSDGMHLLQSVFALVDWADTLHFERRSDARLMRHDLGEALPAEDLCLRAARALQVASGTALGADINIVKQVPWGAGLGGGSSDAASTLLALNRLWGLNWPLQTLAAIGLTLGADVPFFLGGHNAFVQGVGEVLTPIALPDGQAARYAVVKPAAAIATRGIFSHPALKRDTEAVILTGSQEIAGTADWPAAWGAGFGKNDLQPVAQDQVAEVAQAARWLEARYGNSRMTGSGSAVFARLGTSSAGGTDVPPGAKFLADELPPGWVGRMCRGLARHPLLGWAD
jgi:4-diphosphocytidyl-2-C-methyl-D-erythritol kinase